MTRMIRAGERLPNVDLAEIVGGDLTILRSEQLFAGKRAIVIGVPGAFTPVCSGRHLPDYVKAADQLTSQGYSLIACIAPNDPWTLAQWSRMLDPKGRIRMLSDGNLEFIRKAGLACDVGNLFLGERSRRYLMLLQDAVVMRLTVEPEVESFSCTRAQDVLSID
jgi:2-Cys peroxiredoxin 5